MLRRDMRPVRKNINKGITMNNYGPALPSKGCFFVFAFGVLMTITLAAVGLASIVMWLF